MTDEEELARRLTPEQYRITRCGATERAFTGPWWDEKRPGRYSCVVCGSPLFTSATKYDSGSGWPSFWAPVAEAAVSALEDRSLGMVRTEIRCAGCASHLGHLFSDGPRPTGLRYCMNGTALDFRPDSEDRP